MSTVFDFKKLRWLIKIYAVVQVVLVGLLVYTALLFQAGLAPGLFTKSVSYTLIMQLMLFYPIYRFGAREARLAIDSLQTGLDALAMKSLRNKRLVGDVIKSGVFCFYVVFIWKVPTANPMAAKFFLSMTFFNFILTYLTYFQCFNFVVKREMKSRESQ